MLLSESRFNQYMQAFHNKVSNSPYTIKLIISSYSDGGFESSFVGDSERTATTLSFRALYEKEVPQRMREKYGLPSTVNGTVYLSYKQLKDKGIERINVNTTKVQFEGRTQVVNHVVYLESLYGKYIGVQLFLVDDLKGG